MSDVTVKEQSGTDEIEALMARNAELQEKENEGQGIQVETLLLAKQGTKALSRLNKELYIEGLAQGDIFLQKSKVNLGPSVDVVPLAFVTLYQERESRDVSANFFGYWNKEQAQSFPLAEGSFYDRVLPNGHILIPINWVMVEVLGHPELEKAVVAFKSTGSKIWKKWKEDARERSSSSATLVYTIREEAYSNAQYQWADFGFEYKENLVETDRDKAIFCLKKSNSIRESYEKSTLIADRKLVAAPVQAHLIEDATGVEESFDVDEDF